MNRTDQTPDLLDEFVEAFEMACEDGCDVDVADFLPDLNHPDYPAVVTELVRVDLEYGWRRECPRPLESYVQRFPDVFVGDALHEIAFEEYRMRRQAGESVTRDDYRERLSVPSESWPELPVGAPAGAELSSPPSSQLTSGDSSGADIFPSVGEKFLDYQLIGELGRGAFARVYLARQGGLSNRFVVLKVSPHEDAEPQRLAQLQHTNIVPIYSLHRHDGLQAVCMPFLGPNTLADILGTFQVSLSLPLSGKALVSTIAAHQMLTVVREARKEEQDAPDSRETESEPLLAAQRLSNMTYRDAAAWITCRLADGLAHAHEHGIIHRDLKPANILLTDDGEPLILDFNLAVEKSSAAQSALVGGTLPYMAPEHLRALRSGGQVSPQCDIYSLGVILFEMLTGTTPYAVPSRVRTNRPAGADLPNPDPSRVRTNRPAGADLPNPDPSRVRTNRPAGTDLPNSLQPVSLDQLIEQMLADRQRPAPLVGSRNKLVSADLESIVERAITFDPTNRYQTARQLQEDLQRHLDNLPLMHAPNRSIGERIRKWARRHPRLASAGTVGALCVLVMVMLAGALALRGKQIARDQAYAQWRQLRTELARSRRSLNTPYIGLAALDDSVRSAEAVLEKYGLPDADWEEGESWQRIAPHDRSSLRRDLAEVLYLVASGKGQQVIVSDEPAQRERLLQEALVCNEVAGSTLGSTKPPMAFSLQRARLLAVDRKATVGAGDVSEPSVAPRLSKIAIGESEPSDPWDCRLLAFEAAKGHDPARAAALLEGLIKVTPQDPAAWFSLGNCYLDLHRYAEAEGSFTTAIALHPEFTLGYDHRGLARLALGKHREAEDDFSMVISQRPDTTTALVNRALARRAQGENQQAIQDLSAALRKGATQTRIFFIRARLKLTLNDNQGAAADRKEGLRRTPRDELSWIARGIAQLKESPDKALADFHKAVELNPRSRSGWQNLAHVLSERLGKPDQALEAMNRLVAIAPSDPESLASRGVLHARLGNGQQAVKDGQAALKSATDPFVIYQIGCIYSLVSAGSAGDQARAIELVAKALRQDPALAQVAGSDNDLKAVSDSAALKRVLAAARILSEAAERRANRQ